MAYTTACVFHSDKPIWMLKQSAERLGVPLRPYGMDDDVSFRGWVDIKIWRFRKAACQFAAEGFTHIFYSDGRDSFLLGGTDEIEFKYQTLGAPPYLIATEDRCYPFPEHCFSFPDPGHQWRWLGAGQFICEIQYALTMWNELEARYGGIDWENHDQGWLMLGYVDGILDRQEFVLDIGCQIFQSAAAEHFEQEKLIIRDKRVINTVTNSEPCALHFPGGYSDPVTGKEEMLMPYWKQLS